MTAESTPAPLAFTGERFLPEVTGEIWHEHWHRYVLAMPLARDLRVLDAACGEGYGSALLGRVAREVTGVDVAHDAVAHATRRYAGPGVRFAAASCTALPFPDASFDLVVSFETIEHLAAQREMLAEFRRVLAPAGVLMLSSPNQPAYAALGPGRNEFHVRELTRDELAELLAPAFPEQCWYGQGIVARSAVWREGAPHDAVELIELDREGSLGVCHEPSTPVYFVVLAAAAGVPLPAIPAFSLFGDPAASLLGHYRGSVLRAAQLYWDERNASKIAEERQQELVEAVHALAGERESAKARIGELEARLAQARNDIEALRRRTRWRDGLWGWLWRPLARWRARRRGPVAK